ncbi:MAG: TetR/AcrR family transcriptional regulator [Aquabacterium sp.]
MTSSAKPYHHGNLRSALIEAGLAALEKTDSADISLRALARDVGVSANAAYRHFEDKDALLAALAAEGFRRFAALQVQATQGEADRQTTRRASGRAYVDFARTHPALFRLMFGHVLHAKADPDLKTSALMAFHGLLEAAAKDAGTASNDPRALLTAIMRWSLVHGLSHLMLDGQLDYFSADVNQLIDDVLGLPLQPGAAPEAAQASDNKASG